MRKRVSAEAKRRLREADAQLSAKLYARKAQKGVEPNDRRYSRSVGKEVKQMRPEALDALLRGED